MNLVNINSTELKPAPWNPNIMDEKMIRHLKESISRYGLVEPLVVRPIDGKGYEVLSGNQHLKVMKNMEINPIPCIIVNLGDTEAMLLAQALNGLHGEDDLALKGDLFKKLLSSIPEDKVLSLLPETTESLKSLAGMSEMDIIDYLKTWEEAQAARLRNMQIRLTNKQLEMVEEAISLIVPRAKDTQSDNPNTRGNAVFLLCKFYLERREPE